MDAQLRENKRIIRGFMAAQYTDARLVQLLDHCRAGKFAFTSCCCFVGVVTADHALRGEEGGYAHENHYDIAIELPDAASAEGATYMLGANGNWPGNDGLRMRRLIPMVKAEIRRRMAASKPTVTESELTTA